MKSRLIAQRKTARVVLSMETVQQAVQELPALRQQLLVMNNNDPRIKTLDRIANWLRSLVKQGANATQYLDDAAYPKYAAVAKQYVDWVASLRNFLR